MAVAGDLERVIELNGRYKDAVSLELIQQVIFIDVMPV